MYLSRFFRIFIEKELIFFVFVIIFLGLFQQSVFSAVCDTANPCYPGATDTYSYHYKCCDSYEVSLPPPYNSSVCDGHGGLGTSHGLQRTHLCYVGVVPGSYYETTETACSPPEYCGGNQVCFSYCFTQGDCGISNCDYYLTGSRCEASEHYLGACSGGGGGEENNFCSLASPSGTYKGVNHTCAGTGTGDFTVQMGDTFSLNYSYLGTGPSFPLEARTIMRGPQGVAPTETLDCVYTEDAAVGVWHSVTKAGFTCPATPGTYDYTIRCKASDNPSPAICGYFDDSLGCRVKCVVPPASLGYLKIYHQALGVIKLNLISAGDAKAKSPFPGMVKVARFNGDTNSAADLVPVSDPMASPVRVYTGLTGAGSPNGIWAWKKLP